MFQFCETATKMLAKDTVQKYQLMYEVMLVEPKSMSWSIPNCIVLANTPANPSDVAVLLINSIISRIPHI